MDRLGIKEVKKFFTAKKCNVDHIFGCYVNGSKDIVAQWHQRLMSLTEEEYFKYLDLFRKCFSGALDKTMFNVTPEKSKRDFWLELRNTCTDRSLKALQEESLDELYNTIISEYEYVGNYAILIANGIYDVPGKTSDDQELEDASEEVYQYLLICICPVQLAKAGLGYDSSKGTFTNIDRDWLLGDPDMGLLYPAFNDRSEDRDAALAYIKGINDDKKNTAQRLLGCGIKDTPMQEKESFLSVIGEVLGYRKRLGEVRRVNEELRKQQSGKEEDETIGIDDIRSALEAAGIDRDRIDTLERVYASEIGEGERISLNNVLHNSSFTVRTDRGTLKMDNCDADYADIRQIDGKPYLMLELFPGQDVTVNGIDVHIQEG